MPREIKCPRCQHVLIVPDDAPPAPLTCPQCSTVIEAAGQGPNAPEAGRQQPSLADPGLPAVPPENVKGSPLYSSGPMIFGLLLPALTVSVIVWIGFIYQKGRELPTAFHRSLGLVCPFFLLDILVVTQLAYWLLVKRPNIDTLKAAGNAGARAVLFIGAAVAAVIFLFATCYALVN